MKRIKITSGEYTWIARLNEAATPQTCAWFLRCLPYKTLFLQGRWSGNAVFARLQTSAANVPWENATTYPQNGQIVLYPGDAVQGGGEIYMPYGANAFACEYGKIAGNPFLTIIEGQDSLPQYGELVHSQGAQEVLFEWVDQQ